jgi:hypothetical protein
MWAVHKKKDVTDSTNSVGSLFGFSPSMSKPPPFAVGASAAHPVDLLTSDSSEDEYLWGGASLAGNPRHGEDEKLEDDGDDDGDEDDDQHVKSAKKPPVSNMTPPFTSFTKKDGKYAYSQVGEASNNKTNAPQNLSKRKQNWHAQLGAATAHFEMDPTFLSLSTGAGPISRLSLK